MKRGGFALIDVMLTVSLIGVLAMVALPALKPSDSLRAVAAATTLAADLEFAQSASLAMPNDPVVVRFVSEGVGYYLARQSDVNTPITKVNGEPYEVVYGAGLASHLGGLELELASPAGAQSVSFDSFGRLSSGQDAVYEITGATGSVQVRVRASTGSVVLE